MFQTVHEITIPSLWHDRDVTTMLPSTVAQMLTRNNLDQCLECAHAAGLDERLGRVRCELDGQLALIGRLGGACKFKEATT